MTILARKVAKDCCKLYLEGYTAVLPKEEEDRLESIVGPWEKIMREGIEMPKAILNEAKTMAVGLLVVGDPMQATTHIDLELYCKEEDINFHVVPGLSATSLAISLSGMQSYRFGRQITLPYPHGNYLPTSPLELCLQNYENGLHTLVLLDLDPTGMGIEKPNPMQPIFALNLIEIMMSKYVSNGGDNVRSSAAVKQWNGILLSDLGSSTEQVIAGTLSELSDIESGSIHTLIITAKFSGMEEEAFNRRRRLA
jgi:diphthine synthase